VPCQDTRVASHRQLRRSPRAVQFARDADFESAYRTMLTAITRRLAPEMKSVLPRRLMRYPYLKSGLARNALQDRRQTLPAADAHRLEPIAHFAPLHLVRERGENAPASCTDRMSERDARAVDVQPLEIRMRELPLPGAGEDLGSERSQPADDTRVS
jgi:hypothetical protein